MGLWIAGAQNVVTASSDGSYTLGGLPAGDYKVLFAPRYWVDSSSVQHVVNFAEQWYSNQILRTTSQPTTLGSGQTIGNIDAALRPEISFTDIPSNAPFFSEITWLGSTGVSTGYGDGTYRPLNSVNRDAMAAFLYRLAGSPTFTAPASSPFTDVATNNPFYKQITWLAAQGISTGWTEADGTKTFRPLNSVNRDAMAAFMNRYASLVNYGFV